ncbi:DoxX family membrane protein [Candidatus Sumerlaeota bacterium]|nr:DoxX family membrane protein [Candidatus Sumerlaeota bacterium]
MDDLRQRNLALAHLLLRLIPGILFLFAGLNKFIGGYGNFVSGMTGMFSEADTWLPMFMITPYTYALPFAEVALGTLCVLGLFTRQALTLAGLLLLSLAFGQILLGNHGTVFNNMSYVALTAAALATAEFRTWSLDGMMKR